MLKLTLLTLFFVSTSLAEIMQVEFGGKVPQEGEMDLYFTYNNPSVSECVVALKNKDEAYKAYGLVKFPCSGGSNVFRSLTLQKDFAPIGSNYIIEIQLYNNGVKTDYRSVGVAVEFGRQGFHTYQGKLYDANKKEFMIRGINNAHGTYDNYNRNLALYALPSIKNNAKANTVRIEWYSKRDNPADMLPISHLDKIIAECIRNKLVPLVELHDTTDMGRNSNNPSQVKAAAQYWANNVWLLIKYRKHLIVNIANEWSLHGMKPYDWKVSYEPCIDVIRKAGFSGTLVIDAPAYAQDPNGPKQYGPALYQFDPSHNLVFSCHLYFEWSDNYQYKYDIVSELQAIKNAGIPFIVGEFSNQHDGTDSSGKKIVGTINAKLIMQECLKHRFGYLAWSWCGNGTVSEFEFIMF